MSDEVERFAPGTAVRRKSQPDAVGVIRDNGYLQEATGDWIYRVQFGNATRGVAAAELEPLPEYTDAWDDIRAGTFAGAAAFRTLMTFERLRRPPSPIAASFGSAKAAFYPFQFKPLLKFLENPRKRLLIADDVGLGKTIEAGYILRELKSRTVLERTLIVVPSRLRTKWQAEMDRRFGERFDIIASRDLIGWAERMETRRELSRFAWIVSIESARQPAVTEFLNEMQPHLDFVVVDEAHRMRNPQTLQHRLGKALSACADHMLFLTATPVQTGLENLFRLLNILDEYEFQDASVFEEQCEANRPVIQAATAIRLNPPRGDLAVDALNHMKRNSLTRPLTESAYFSNLLSRCKKAPNLDREELVELQRDINELSLTGKIISRTRKADVLQDRTIRKPFTLKFQYSAVERAFYDSVAELCEVTRPDLWGWGQAMAALQAFRATASCIPAAARRFREKLEAGRSLVHDLVGDFDEGDEPDARSQVLRAINSRIDETLGRISSSIQSLTEEDTKYEDFRRRLQAMWRDAEIAATKVVVFSFFKPTLRYLNERLGNDGIECRIINGDVAMGEREARIEQFATSPRIPVLLSSEVGSEGLDLQFASVVVNYDLPWNPMVIEQRIGRIDRIGQAEDSITVLNLVAADTIEERILLRLYDRIGIFEESIGELDPILGETVETLASQALRGELSEADQAARADLSADAMKDQRLQAESLSRNADSLMAADQSFLDEIDGLIGGRKVPTETELYDYVRRFLTSRFNGSRFPEAVVEEVAEVRTPPGVGNLVLQACPNDPEGFRFGRALETGPVKATFDQNAAMKHANAELLHPRHPLVTMVTSERDRHGSRMARSFALRLYTCDLANAAVGLHGDYAFEIHLFEATGVRPRVTLVPLFVDNNDLCLDERISEDLLLSILDSADSLEPAPRLGSQLLDDLSSELQRHLASRREQTESKERELNNIRQERLRATLATALDHRVDEAKRRLRSLREKGAAPFSITMATAKLDRAERERATSLDPLRNSQRPVLETELLAAGVLHIEPA